MADKRVVITGSTRGIGRGLAEEFLQQGCSVAVSGRSADTVDAVVAELRQTFGERVVGAACDVADEAQVQTLWDTAAAAFGGVDIWINNAGISHTRKPLADLDVAEIDTVVTTNVLGSINGCRVAIAGMAAAGGGSVWNMEGFGSTGMTAEGISVYGATKRSLRYLVKALAKEAKATNVRVCALSPGIVATDLLAKDYAGQTEAFEKARKIFNILGDEVSTVTPFLVRGVLREPRNGGRVAWLTKRKASWRFATAGITKRQIVLPNERETGSPRDVVLPDVQGAKQ